MKVLNISRTLYPIQIRDPDLKKNVVFEASFAMGTRFLSQTLLRLPFNIHFAVFDGP